MCVYCEHNCYVYVYQVDKYNDENRQLNNSSGYAHILQIQQL